MTQDTTKLDEKALRHATKVLASELGADYFQSPAVEKAIRAYLSALAHEPAAEWRVPTGWKLVPVEPTLYMLRRADGLTDLVGPYLGANTVEERRNEFACAWKAMLDAAPPPPEVQP